MAPLRTLLLLCAVAACSAYPYYWAEEYALKASSPCTSQPTRPDGRHPSVVASDRTTTFAVVSVQNRAVTKVCRGQSYTITVSFPQNRLILASTTVGTLTGNVPQTAPTGGNFPNCPNRFVYGKAGATTSRKSYILTLKVPANAVAAPLLRTTSASGPSSPFYQASLSLPFDTTMNCAARG